MRWMGKRKRERVRDEKESQVKGEFEKRVRKSRAFRELGYGTNN